MFFHTTGNGISENCPPHVSKRPASPKTPNMILKVLSLSLHYDRNKTLKLFSFSVSYISTWKGVQTREKAWSCRQQWRMAKQWATSRWFSETTSPAFLKNRTCTWPLPQSASRFQKVPRPFWLRISTCLAIPTCAAVWGTFKAAMWSHSSPVL